MITHREHIDRTHARARTSFVVSSHVTPFAYARIHAIVARTCDTHRASYAHDDARDVTGRIMRDAYTTLRNDARCASIDDATLRRTIAHAIDMRV